MRAVRKVTITNKYYVTEDEAEKIYETLYRSGNTACKYAESKGVDKDLFHKVLRGKNSMTKNMYVRAFKEFSSILDLPEDYKRL